MTIWILALLLMGCSAGVGHRQGAIRTAFSLIGIPVAALLASPFSRFVKPVVKVLGVSNPALLSIIGDLVVFIIILSIFKAIGFWVHKRVEVFYKYKVSELRRSLWERLNSRLGLCIGLINGLFYLALISTVIYVGSYWTVQLASPDKDPKVIQFFNKLGKDLEVSGMSHVAAALDWMPDTYYATADIVGLIYHNPLLEARLSRYPAFLSLGERPEFQAIANDQKLMEARLKGASIRELMQHDQIKEIMRKPDMLKLIWDTVVPNLKDLRGYLETGRSPKYDSEPILGRWFFSAGGSLSAYRKEKPNIPNSEMQRIRQWMAERFAKTKIVVAPDHKVIIKEFPKPSPAGGQPSTETQTLIGKWKGGDGDYVLTMDTTGEERTVHIENGKWSMRNESLPLVFDKEE